jgi:hypothetical protein
VPKWVVSEWATILGLSGFAPHYAVGQLEFMGTMSSRQCDKMTAVQRLRFRRILLPLGALVLLLVATEILRLAWLLHRPVHIRDDFEEPKLSSIWTAGKMVPGAFSTQREIVHSGHSAAQITIHPNDRFEAASDDGAASERDELMEAPQFWSRPGRTYDYSFSLYLPKDFPIVERRLVIAQWKQRCEWEPCPWRIPNFLKFSAFRNFVMPRARGPDRRFIPLHRDPSQLLLHFGIAMRRT